jgi:hypothetical protein
MRFEAVAVWTATSCNLVAYTNILKESVASIFRVKI